MMDLLLDWAMKRKYAFPLAAIGTLVAGLLVYVSFQFYLVFGMVAALMGAGFDAAKLFAAYMRPKFRDSNLKGTNAAARIFGFLMIIGMMFSFSATTGFLSDLDDSWKSDKRLKSAGYLDAKSEIKKLQQLMLDTSASAHVAVQAETEMLALQSKLQQAEYLVSKYVNTDGSYKTDSRGRKFRTAGNAATAKRGSILSEMKRLDATVEAGRRHEFSKSRITELKQEISGMSGDQASIETTRPFFRLTAKWINSAGANIDAEHVAFGFFLMLALFGEMVAATSMGMIHRAVLIATEEKEEKGRPARIERLLEKQAKSHATQAGLLENAWKMITRTRTPEYVHGYEDGKSGQKAKNPYQTTDLRTEYKAGYDVGLKESMAHQEPAPQLSNSAIMTADDSVTVNKQPQIVHPWMRRGDVVMIHAKEGVGKSLLGFAVAKMIVDGGQLFRKWSATPAKVLFVDGEMGQGRVNDRMQDMQLNSPNFSALCYDALPEHAFPNIFDAVGQGVVDTYMSHVRPDVVFLDSLAILGGDMFRNDSAWSLFQGWLAKHQAAGISFVLIHHDNKKGDQDGKQNNNRKLATRIQLIERKSTAPGLHVRIEYQKHRDFHGADKEPIDATYLDGVWSSENTERNGKTQRNGKTEKHLRTPPKDVFENVLVETENRNVSPVSPHERWGNARNTLRFSGEEETETETEKHHGNARNVSQETLSVLNDVSLPDGCNKREKITAIADALEAHDIEPTGRLVANLSGRINGAKVNAGHAHNVLQSRKH